MSEISSYILSTELQEESKILKYGSYELSRTPPIINNTNSTSLVTSSGTWLEFEVPSKCINNSKNRIDLTLVIPKVTTDALYYVLYNDGVPLIKNIQFVTRGGQYIVRVDEADRYAKLFRYTTTQKKFKTLTNIYEDTALTSGGANANLELTKHRGLAKVNNVSKRIAPGGTTLTDINDETEPAYFTVTGAVVSGGGATGTLRYPISIPLNMYKDTFFNVDKDVNFGEIVLLRIELNDPARLGLYNDTQNITSPTANIAGYYIENPYLYMAVQKNQDIIDMVNKSDRQNILTRFVRSAKLSGPGTSGVDYTITNRINTSDGSHLVRIYVQPYNYTETGAASQDRSNLSITATTGVMTPHKITKLHTEVDSIRRQQFDLDCSKYEDYEYIRPLLEGSCVGSAQQYAQNFCWIENFGSNYPIADIDWSAYDKSKMIEGAPIEKEIKYDFVYTTTANNTQNYFHIVTLKTVTIDKNSGISVHS